MKPGLFSFQKNNFHGFTLIEIMFAFLILSVMTAVLYNALFTAMRSVRIVERSFESPRKVLFLSRMFERELTGIYLPEEVISPVPMIGEGENQKPAFIPIKERMKFGIQGKEKELHFTALIEMREDQNPPLGDMMEFGYIFESSEKKLFKRMDPVIDDRIDKDGEKVELPFQVESLKFEYYGTKWESSWNSEKEKKLPRAIRIRFTLFEEGEEGEKLSEEVEENTKFTHQVVVLLPNAVDNKKL